MSDTTPTRDRCGYCLNCKHIERVQARVLSVLTFPGSNPGSKGHGVDAAALWHRELAASPCVADAEARAQVEAELFAAGIIEDPDTDGGLFG